jgi:hypothetical protein
MFSSAVSAGAAHSLETIVQGTSIMGRGILLWMLGVPLPVILLLAMCSHH